MIIDHEREFVFVHVPKTGGNSVLRPLYDTPCPDGDVVFNQDLTHGDNVLFPWNFKHNHEYASRQTIERLGYFSFSMVRNPWDRMVSLYHWGFRLASIKNVMIDFELPFIDFIKRIQNGTYIPGHINALAVSQTRFLSDARGPIVDFVVKMEHMQRDMDYVCDKLDIPRIVCRVINRNADRTFDDYHEYYDDESRKLVAAMYADDVENFGYIF